MFIYRFWKAPLLVRDISLGLCLLFSGNLYHCSAFHLRFTFPSTVSWSVFWRCYQSGLVKNCSDVLQNRLCSLTLEQRSKRHKPRLPWICASTFWQQHEFCILSVCSCKVPVLFYDMCYTFSTFNYVITVQCNINTKKIIAHIFQSWQLSEDFSMVMDMTMLMYLVLAE